MPAGAIKYSAAPGIKQRIVLQEANDLFDRVEARPTILQHCHANVERLAQRWLDSANLSRVQLLVPAPGPAMDGDRKSPSRARGLSHTRFYPDSKRRGGHCLQ